jgi:hypothetical protein
LSYERIRRLRARLMLASTSFGAQQLDRPALAIRVEDTQHVIGQTGGRPTVK